MQVQLFPLNTRESFIRGLTLQLFSAHTMAAWRQLSARLDLELSLASCLAAGLMPGLISQLSSNPVRFDSMARVFLMFLWRFLLGFPRTTQSRKISKTMSFYKQRYNNHFSGGSITLVFYDGANAIIFP